MTTDNPHVHPGALVHFLETLTVPTSEVYGSVLGRGATIELDAAIIEAGLDRDGNSWLDMLGDDEGQIERWGVVRFRPGSWPAGDSRWIHGSPDWQDAREQARKRAWAISDPEERAEARAAVERDYGPALSSVTTLREVR